MALKAAAGPGFGDLLRGWRQRRGSSQLALALAAEVSARHLSWLETGKAAPSRAMVLRLAERLDLPPRERNTLLHAAGYAPLFAERALQDPALAPARATLERLLAAHEPWPALAVDRHWNLVAHNAMLPALLQGLPPEMLAPPVNVLRLSLHPRGLAPAIGNLPAWRAHVLARLQRQAAATGDPVLDDLLVELRNGEPPADESATAGDLFMPLQLHTPAGLLQFITTTTVFGAPHDVTLAEIAIETLLPADEATAARLQAMKAALPVA